MNEGADCPDENALVGFVHRTLPPAQLSAVEVHLSGCDVCRAVVAQLARELSPHLEVDPTTIGEPALAQAAVLASGTQVGRYRIEGRLGAGGMGVVYQASDPELGRSVALKVLRAEGDGSAGDGRARLMREAQTMAKLSHPNVVALYELGTHQGHVFLAMELVRGVTLGQWLARQRSTAEILAVFRQAGLGLAAAHEAGLVHRDFKPANVLVSDDGRVRVTDFGLARAAATPTPDASSQSAAVGIDTLTKTGMIVGTPAYMAPEQLSGGLTDPRTDQFSFCVTLYEALFGVRPFEGHSLAELHGAVKAELIREPVSGRSVDSRLRRVVLRGLRPEPRDRFASMGALLEALEERPPRRWPMVLALSVVAAIAVVGGVRVVTSRASEELGPQIAKPETIVAPNAKPEPIVTPIASAAPVVEPGPAEPVKVEAPPAVRPPVRAPAVAKTKKKSGEGLLSLHVAPWGEVSIDGRAISSANMMDYVVTLGAGRHEVVVRHPQLGSRTETVAIEPGKTVERRVSLR